VDPEIMSHYEVLWQLLNLRHAETPHVLCSGGTGFDSLLEDQLCRHDFDGFLHFLQEYNGIVALHQNGSSLFSFTILPLYHWQSSGV
jgi:hypothetical protein